MVKFDILKNWMIEHIDHPYPDLNERSKLSSQTGLSEAQVHLICILGLNMA